MIFFLALRFAQRKNPPALVAGGLVILRSVGPFLVQAIAVRRHGDSMMVVMTVMAAALHLTQG